MKKNTIISAIAIGLGFFLTTSVQAIHPVHYTGLLLNIENEMDSQKKLVVQDWMLSAEAFSVESKNSRRFIGSSDLIKAVVTGTCLARSCALFWPVPIINVRSIGAFCESVKVIK